MVQSEDSGEEWDRHEALHNDVTNQERTTERLFEDDMEVTWDKGSSGLVFYTDAAFWDKQAGGRSFSPKSYWVLDLKATWCTVYFLLFMHKSMIYDLRKDILCDKIITLLDKYIPEKRVYKVVTGRSASGISP